jgi:hypothetical protein
MAASNNIAGTIPTELWGKFLEKHGVDKDGAKPLIQKYNDCLIR